MQCPECKAARTYVSTTKTHETGGVYRYRKCSGCAFTFVSLELLVPEEERPKVGRPPTVNKVVKPKEPKKPRKARPEKPIAHNKPKLRVPLSQQDANLINKIRTEVRRKLEDLKYRDEDEDY